MRAVALAGPLGTFEVSADLFRQQQDAPMQRQQLRRPPDDVHRDGMLGAVQIFPYRFKANWGRRTRDLSNPYPQRLGLLGRDGERLQQRTVPALAYRVISITRQRVNRQNHE
ncbi:hypothetical protein FJY94_02675 [Candidatus Kaiserbacteria bacterium]|nr:hypothetical protein [Candidatus Kaiserbacteria bacterium]